MSKFHPAGKSEITFSFDQVLPPSNDLLKTKPFGPAHATYTCPLGPTAGTAPSTVLSLSLQSPPCWSILNAGDQVIPPSEDFENKMCELSSGLVLSYLSNRVHVV